MITLLFRHSVWSFCRLGLSMRFSELEFSVISFVRAPSSGAAPTPLDLPYPFRTSTWTWTGPQRTRQAENAFFHVFWAVFVRVVLGSWHIYNEEIKGQHFQNGFISKLESKFLPDVAFFMSASNRLPYRIELLPRLLCAVAFRLSGYIAT